MNYKMNAEEQRIKEVSNSTIPPWEAWGPYVSERQWGTVREDYSENGDPWNYVTHDDARSRAYRWGEDGIAGICDRFQVLSFSLAFWNHQDPILKERLFGLSGPEGNHGEDVKEYYYYLDSTPTHSYMKYLYKYPQARFPYEDLVEENKRRGLADREYELIDTGVFDEDRYFDIFIEYAKVNPHDICIKIQAFNRGPEEAILDIIPQLTFRNIWSWAGEKQKRPVLKRGDQSHKFVSITADDEGAEMIPFLGFDYRLGKRYIYADNEASVLFTNNETNTERISGIKNANKYVKDAFHRYIVNQEDVVNHQHMGTKAAFHFEGLKIKSQDSATVCLRITDHELKDPLDDVEHWMQIRKAEADDFYASIHPEHATDDQKRIQRQALAGMLWSKQIYNFHVNRWLEGDDPKNPPPESRKEIRNTHWKHLISKRIMSMPDKWEYPWFAAWDLSFQCLPLALVDIEFAKDQLWLLLFDQFQHPNGQIPAYEWEFSELNPPVQAWAVWFVYKMEYERTGVKDRSFLHKCFHKMMINFVWWVNRVDATGNNVFEGGFLGLDNITVIDRSQKIPGGGKLEQSDGTGWMGLFCLLLMRIALELSYRDSDYEPLAVKFFEHFVYIGAALDRCDQRQKQNWSEDDGFFYDVLCFPDGTHEQIAVRSLVGLIPMYAVDYISDEELQGFKEFSFSFNWFLKNRAQTVDPCITRIDHNGKSGYLIALMKPERMKRILEKAWDPKEFKSEYGLRSLSKYHEKHPYELYNHSVYYDPGECHEDLKGGNSNWRGPIWFPTSFLFVDMLYRLHAIIGDSIKIKVENEAPVDLLYMANYFAKSMIRIFEEENGRRAVFGDYEKFQNDPNFKDHILFYEHFHGDTGRGLGASHQTGWTGLVAVLIDRYSDKKRD